MLTVSAQASLLFTIFAMKASNKCNVSFSKIHSTNCNRKPLICELIRYCSTISGSSLRTSEPRTYNLFFFNV